MQLRKPEQLYGKPGLSGRPLKLILEHILVHPDGISLRKKTTHHSLVEARNPRILTVGREKSVRKPGDKSVPKGINTQSPTNIFLVCRLFHDVGIPLYYGKNVFVSASEEELDAWAGSIRGRAAYVMNITSKSEWEIGFVNMDMRQKRLHMEHTGGLISLQETTKQLPLDLKGLALLTLQVVSVNACDRKYAFFSEDKKSPKAEEMCNDFALESAEKLEKQFCKINKDFFMYEVQVITEVIPKMVDEKWFRSAEFRAQRQQRQQ